MEKLKPTRNNPDPIPFIKIKTEPEQANPIVTETQEAHHDANILTFNKNHQPNEKNSNPNQFKKQQDESRDEVNLTSFRPNEREADSAKQETSLEIAKQLAHRIETQAIEIQRLSKENESKSLKLLLLEDLLKKANNKLAKEKEQFEFILNEKSTKIAALEERIKKLELKANQSLQPSQIGNRQQEASPESSQRKKRKYNQKENDESASYRQPIIMQTKTDEEKMKALKSNLTCWLTKSSFLTNKEIILGYPVLVKSKQNPYEGRTYKIQIELLSYDGYMMQNKNLGNKTEMFTSNGNPFTHWIPCYLNDDHFMRSFQLLINSISLIDSRGLKNSNRNSEQIDFNPISVLNILPYLINSLIVSILDGTIHHSRTAIQAYCHFLRLYYKLIQFFPVLKAKILNDVENFKNIKNYRDKKFYPDLGEFVVSMFLSETNYDDIKKCLFNEFMCRNIFWIEQNKKLELIPNEIFMEKVFEYSKISNHFLMFNKLAANFLISAETMNQLDRNVGFMPEETMAKFESFILRVKSVSSFSNERISISDFLKYMKLDDYNSDEEFRKMIFDCKNDAIFKGYLKKT